MFFCFSLSRSLFLIRKFRAFILSKRIYQNNSNVSFFLNLTNCTSKKNNFNGCYGKKKTISVVHFVRFISNLSSNSCLRCFFFNWLNDCVKKKCDSKTVTFQISVSNFVIMQILLPCYSYAEFEKKWPVYIASYKGQQTIKKILKRAYSMFTIDDVRICLLFSASSATSCLC